MKVEVGKEMIIFQDIVAVVLVRASFLTGREFRIYSYKVWRNAVVH